MDMVMEDWSLIHANNENPKRKQAKSGSDVPLVKREADFRKNS